MIKRTTEELDAGLDHIRDAPSDDGELRLIVRRPAEDEREVIEEGDFDLESGLVGDNWLPRGNPLTDDGLAHPLAQLTIMNSRVLDVIAGPIEHWAAAGDQLYVDLDLSHENLPPGTRLAIGGGIVEVTEKPIWGAPSSPSASVSTPTAGSIPRSARASSSGGSTPGWSRPGPCASATG